ncbi:hypothetical protein ACQUZK_08635 [Streptococcus pyogenes]|uniref:hypothetical protein n=1 Tax=Streptococcus pyogenes TaxID=1314 RepID=UPI003DA03DF3
MDTAPGPAARGSAYELRFAGLFNTGRGFAFPCDAQGKVDVAVLGERARASYLRACRNVGRDLCAPVTCIAPARNCLGHRG